MSKDKLNQKLHDAAGEGLLGVVKDALKAGADINHNHVKLPFYTPLLSAINAGHTDIAAYLIDVGADLTITGFQNTSPLRIAIESHNKIIACKLIGLGVDIANDFLVGEYNDIGDAFFPHIKSNLLEAAEKVLDLDLLNIIKATTLIDTWLANNADLTTVDTKELIDLNTNTISALAQRIKILLNRIGGLPREDAIRIIHEGSDIIKALYQDAISESAYSERKLLLHFWEVGGIHFDDSGIKMSGGLGIDVELD